MPRSVTLSVTVEFEDVDAYGIAHHTRLIAYLERARLRLLFDDMGVGLKATALPVMYQLDTRFLRPGRLLDELALTAELTGHDAFTLRIRYELRRGDEVLLKARSVVAFAAADGGGPVPVPPAVLDRLGLPSESP